MALVAITRANVIASAGGLAATDYARLAAEEIEAGEVVYVDDSGAYALVDADNATGTESTRTYGIALNHAYTGQPVSVVMKDTALVVGGTLTAGRTYYNSTTPGSIGELGDLGAGDFPVALGIAVSTTVLNFNPTAAGVAL